ncbi:MAG: TonB-dependent receptor [Paludibacteraceae bacterium]|nr:TonB-dependent receptor [Paludibacteraceae bacterium]
MHLRILVCAFAISLLLLPHSTQAQTDTLLRLQEIVVERSRKKTDQLRTALPAQIVGSDFLDRHFNGNLTQTLQHIPGVRSMDIGAGFSKPVIRGLGFNRIAVTDNGVKQEGQQWGADHGLEIDAFDISRVTLLKGPASLLYGSDAMGGVIEIQPEPMPAQDGLTASISLLGKSVNDHLGISVMAGVKRRWWMLRLRYTEQHFGDMRIPADTVDYLTIRLPLLHRRLKNTAGTERDASLLWAVRRGRYMSNLQVSTAWQKTGFFPGAHGVPDPDRLADDGSSRNIELPYSWVNHLKVSTHQQVAFSRSILTADIGYQLNHREEWSAFHTHYQGQTPPTADPDRELMFQLHTGSANVRWRMLHSDRFEQSVGLNAQLQKNSISGYGFLLPAYYRTCIGAFWIATWRPHARLSVTGGLRYDIGAIRTQGHHDSYLAEYLQQQGYSYDEAEQYAWNSRAISRTLADYSGSVGLICTINPHQTLKLNIGRSFRLPAANELAANGLHHGTFRHEQGASDLQSEHGWQIDASWSLEHTSVNIEVSPFVSIYDNYIFLDPTGRWSPLPHAGQIYQYSAARAIFYGGEVSVEAPFARWFAYRLAADYVHTYNRDSHTALSFSPPASMRNSISFSRDRLQLELEVYTIAAQHRIAHNEQPTPGATLLNGSATYQWHLHHTDIIVQLRADNLLNKRYYNHLSYYRQIQLPEAGRNLTLSVKIPFHIDFKKP